jgi:hypothetical protein
MIYAKNGAGTSGTIQCSGGLSGTRSALLRIWVDHQAYSIRPGNLSAKG